MEACAEGLRALGYTPLPHPDHAFAPFFYRAAGWPHTHPVHGVRADSAAERGRLAFRGFLRTHPSHPDVAREYEALKRSLAPRFDVQSFASRQACADARGELIRRVPGGALARAGPPG